MLLLSRCCCHLFTGNIYHLHCIVYKDSSTGRYRSSVVKNQCWRMIDDRSDQAASKAEVKTRRNYLYLYVRAQSYTCQVAGCPVEETKFGDQVRLDLHHQTEHPTCSWCHLSFSNTGSSRLNSCIVQYRNLCQQYSGGGRYRQWRDGSPGLGDRQEAEGSSLSW